MINEIEKKRLIQLERCVPDIWDCKDILYIGARQGRFHYYERMLEKKINIYVVEIDPKACEWLLSLNTLASVVCSDIVNYVNEIDIKFETILWSHGPEELPMYKAAYVIGKLTKIYQKNFVCMTPNGDCGGGGNVSVFNEKIFSDLGFLTDADSYPNTPNSNLIAWRRPL